jgi:hypothetical protein
MNLYFVLSEELKEWDTYSEPGEFYCIFSFVSADSSSQARYQAWKTDKYSFSQDIRDIPKMTCELLEKDTKYPKGVVFEKYWDEIVDNFNCETSNYEKWHEEI